jgi:HTH-type transcriptional regulator, global nitrogen regulator NrpRI
MKNTDHVRRAILKALHETDGAAGAARLGRVLAELGLDLSARTIRFHLLRLDREGLTRTVSRRRGRELTSRGREELVRGDVVGKIGFVAARVDDMGYRMTFDPRTGQGRTVANLALIAESDLPRATVHMNPVFARRLAMGPRVAVAHGGETLAGIVVPPGMTGLGTVCSVAVNGMLLKRGVPVTSRFGGLVELRGGRATRFIDLIEYRGSTLDPLEVLIQAGRTRVQDAAATGNGIVGASFREVPNAALDTVRALQRDLRAADMPALMEIGRPNQPLLDIPVAEGRTGILVVAGLNPVAAVHEAGVPVQMLSLAGLEDYERFVPFREAALRARRDSPLID